MPVERRVRVGERSTRVLTAGTGNRDIVLLHGVGARADRWQPTLDRLGSERLRLHAVDFPGHGMAGKGPLDVSVAALAQFVREVLDLLDLECVTVVGTSLGGHVAARLFLDMPHRVDGLVLVGSLGLEPLGQDRTAGIATRMTSLDRESVRAKLLHAVSDPDTITDEWVDEEVAVNTSPGAPESLASYARYFRDGIDGDVVADDLKEALVDRERATPLLLVWGEDDRTVPISVAQKFVEQCRPARLESIAGAAHMPYLEQPDLFAGLVEQFIARTDN